VKETKEEAERRRGGEAEMRRGSGEWEEGGGRREEAERLWEGA
jgi:hypothetical protein